MHRIPLLAALLAASALCSATAVALPRQVEFYFDADAAVHRPILELKDRSDAGVERLTRTVERRPDAALERAQLGHFAMRGGRVEVGRQFYESALAQIDASHSLWRPVKWNYGWDLYRTGDAAAALKHWGDLVARGAPGWAPTTLAIALWSTGQREEAVRWYAAAVRTEPGQWSTPARYAELLPAWTDAERATLAEVQAAWVANPPRWP
ncbi:tetratricopeptide repeat protein [Lysobacter humi (ex Lee et al. 2017)]